MLAFYVAFAKKNNIDPNKIGFFLQNDILKEYMCRGTYIFPPSAGVKLSVDVLEYCGKYLSKWTPIAVSGYHIREAGATAAQEIAFTAADMIAYFDAAVARGVDIVRKRPETAISFWAHRWIFLRKSLNSGRHAVYLQKS